MQPHILPKAAYCI